MLIFFTVLAMNFTQAFITSLVLINLIACSSQVSPIKAWAEFWHPMPQRYVNTVIQRLTATGLPMQSLGSVHYAQQTFPLKVVRVQRVAKQAPVCIFAGVHGNEIAGTEAALSLIDDLARDSSLYPQTNFAILPLVNPWGWEHGFRYNYEGQDIARNFALQGTQETVLVKQLLAKESCRLVVDLHEDSQHSGFYLLTYANPDPSFTPRLVQQLAKALGVEVAKQVPQGVYQVAAEDFANNPRPTLSQYAREQGVEQTYIIETPMQLALEQRVSIHRKVLDKLLTQLPSHTRHLAPCENRGALLETF